ncbi:MAG TPA: cupredoxin domain-containing protein [Solirubrobacteraceae bacterium]|jgi:plastocyanin
MAGAIRSRALALPLLAAAATALVALLLAGHSASSSAGSPSAVVSGHVTIHIVNFAYMPASVTVTRGTRITFTNEDDVEHTATSNAEGVFETGSLHRGQSASFELKRPGSYPYHCAFHAFMHGAIKVVSR